MAWNSKPKHDPNSRGITVKVNNWRHIHCDQHTAGRDVAFPKKEKTTASLPAVQKAPPAHRHSGLAFIPKTLIQQAHFWGQTKQTNFKHTKTLKGFNPENELGTGQYSSPTSWWGSARKTFSTSSRHWPSAPHFNSAKDPDKGNLQETLVGAIMHTLSTSR